MAVFLASSILPSALRQESTYPANAMNNDARPVKTDGARMTKVASRVGGEGEEDNR